jgi:hypothetical protein
MSDVAKTPREELECKKKYLYEYSMFWECKDGSKSQILEDDVCDLLNTQQDKITELEKNFEDLVDWSTEISKRNVLLDEKIGRLQEEEKLYAQEILRLNTLLKQYQANQDLGGGY